MTTATTNTIVDQSTDAAFRVWVAEVITMLFTTLGVTQTADTGQINTSTVTRSASINTAAGYVVGRFNDTAQSTSPIFFKLEFGTGSTASVSPAMWITIGTGSNGSGTLTGTVGTRVACGVFTTEASNITPYVTSCCYNTTAGFLGFVWKMGGAVTGSTWQPLAGFFIFRSADATGAVTTESAMLLTASSTATASGTASSLQTISYLTSTAYNVAAPYNGQQWGTQPFALTTTLLSGNTYVAPVFQATPAPGITPWLGIALLSEWALGSTNTATLVGTTSHTYKAVGSGFGATAFMNSLYGLSTTFIGLVMLWE